MVATGQSEPFDPELGRLADNAALPESVYYAMTVCRAVTEGFISIGFSQWEAVAVAFVIAMYLGVWSYAISKPQRNIRRYVAAKLLPPDTN